MPTTTDPPSGYRWRPARLQDVPLLADFFTAVDAAEGLEEVLGPAGARHELGLPGLNLRRDTLLGLTPDGAVRAFAWVWVQPTGNGCRAIVWVEAHPDHLHLEPFLLAWAEACARWHPVAAAAAEGCYLRQHAEEHRLRRRRALEEAGYRHVRTFVEMWRSLRDEPPGAPPPPSGIEVVPWSASLAEGARRAANAAFALHWDSLPATPEAWQKGILTDPQFRPDLSRLAVGEGGVVGFCLVSVDSDRNTRAQVSEMWLERLGTIPSHQRRGVGAALLGEVLRAGAAAGFARAGLGVDRDSTTRATALYERLGFSATRRTLAYVKDLR